MSLERLGPWPRASCKASSPTFSNLGDGLTKKILEQGKVEWFGSYPRDGDEVSLEYEAFLPDGRMFDSSKIDGTSKPYSFKIGAGGKVMVGWERVVQTMCTDEYAEVFIPSALAHGENGIPGVVPPNTDLTFRIRLVKWVCSTIDILIYNHIRMFF